MGTGGVPIRIRRTLSDSPNSPSLGEPFLNLVDNSLGIFNGTDMCWYPGIDPVTRSMVLKSGQSLTGKDSNGDTNISLDFNTPDQLTVTHKPTDTVLAEISSSGSSFYNLNVTQIPGGYYNRMTHPGFIPELFKDTDSNTVDFAGQFIGPNTYMWKKTGAAGNMRAEYSEDKPATIAGHEIPGSLKVTATNGPNTASGIRCWIFNSYTYESCTIRFSALIPDGVTVEARCGSRIIGYNSVSITGTGDWQRVEIGVPNHTADKRWTATNDPLSVDLCHNLPNGEFYYTEPTLQLDAVSQSELYQYRGLGARLADAARYYWTPHFINMVEEEITYVNLPHRIPAYDGINTEYEVAVNITDTPVSIANKTAEGFSASALGTFSGFWRFKPVIALRGSLADISG